MSKLTQFLFECAFVRFRRAWVPQRVALLGLLAFAAIALSGWLTILP